MSAHGHDLNELLQRMVPLHREPEEEFSTERALTDNALRTLSPAAVPDDLSLRIRLALSHERVRAERRFAGRLLHAAGSFVENWVRPIGVQVAAVAVAVLVTAGGLAMLGAVAPQQAVQAHDEPLAGFSSPRYMYASAGTQPVGSTSDAPLIVKAMIDNKGRVYDYAVLSGSLDESASEALRQRMLAGVFRPARVFDQPVRGSIVLTFADVVVRG